MKTKAKNLFTPVYFKLKETPFRLEFGGILDEVVLAVEAYGRLNRQRSNAILVCHALTGSSHAADWPNCLLETAPPSGSEILPANEPSLLHRIQHYPGWWNGIIGSGKALDPEKYFLISINILGSCYGSTGPLSLNPATGAPHRLDFPQISVRDMVRAQQQVVRLLGIERLLSVVGGSLGGMQVLEWAVMFPEMVESFVSIATAAAHSPWAIAFNEIARQAIVNDPHWQEGQYQHPPEKGLALARMAAMISYRSHPSFSRKFSRQMLEGVDLPGTHFSNRTYFQVENYLHYQGEKLVQRFDANTYLYLSRAMDFHDLARRRAPLPEVLARIQAPGLFIGISSDILYPPREQQEMARRVPAASYREIQSPHGHDAFLIEFEQLNRFIGEFLSARLRANSTPLSDWFRSKNSGYS